MCVCVCVCVCVCEREIVSECELVCVMGGILGDVDMGDVEENTQ